MKSLILLIACVASADNGWWIRSIDGPPYGYRGHSVWVEIVHAMYNAYEVQAIDGTANTIELDPSNTLANGGTIQWFPGDPSAVLPGIIAFDRGDIICGGPTIWTVMAIGNGGCGAIPYLEFTDVGSGSQWVGTPLPNGCCHHVYLKTPTLPTGVTMSEVWCFGESPCQLQAPGYLSYLGSYTYWVRLDISPTATLGNQTITFTLGCDTPMTCADRQISRDFEIKDVPTVAINHPTSFPAIPGLATWESTMLTKAAQFCDKTTGEIFPPGALGFGNEAGVWYYDGGWVYVQIANYTGDLEWLNCANTIGDWYRGAASSATSFYHRVFTDWLMWSCVTCNRAGAVKIDAFFNDNAAGKKNGSPGDNGIREGAYILETNINEARAHGMNRLENVTPGTALHYRLTKAADMALGNTAAYHTPGKYMYHQSFYSGLNLRALIKWYDFSGDARVLPEVKATVDFMISDLIISGGDTMAWHAGHALPGNIAGPRCDYNCWPWPIGDTMNMVTPVFAWLWWMTGDDTYRLAGDQLFENAGIGGNGKQFSQFYRWSFDYVYWRTGRPGTKAIH